MMRTVPALLALAAAAAAPAQAQDEDARHRADRIATERLNREALHASEPRVTYREQDRRDYRAALDRYQRQLREWRQRVAACNAGDQSACEQ